MFGRPRTAPNSASASSGEEQTSEMISSLTMTQLLYILQRIQQLSFHSQDYAKKLLSDSPKLALALIHAQYVVAGKGMDSHLLPLTADEVKIVKDRIAQIRMVEGNPSVHANIIGEGQASIRMSVSVESSKYNNSNPVIKPPSFRSFYLDLIPLCSLKSWRVLLVAKAWLLT